MACAYLYENVLSKFITRNKFNDNFINFILCTLKYSFIWNYCNPNFLVLFTTNNRILLSVVYSAFVP